MTRLHRHRMQGFSLVELMISVTIGLVIVLALTQFFLTALNSQTSQSEASLVNENARFATDLLSREIRKAGFSNTWQSNVTPGGNFCAATNNPSFVGLNDPTTIDPSSATGAGTTVNIYSPYTSGSLHSSNDVLRVYYYGENTTSTAPIYDCQGNPVATGLLVQDTLFIMADPNNNSEPTLYCYSSNPPAVTAQTAAGSPGMPMVPGIESLQLLYGEDTDQDGIVNRFVPAHLITSSDNVSSIKISMVVRGNAGGTTKGTGVPTGPLYHFSASYPASTNTDPSAVFPAAGVNVPADNRLRKLYSSDITFRNFRWCG